MMRGGPGSNSREQREADRQAREYADSVRPIEREDQRVLYVAEQVRRVRAGLPVLGAGESLDARECSAEDLSLAQRIIRTLTRGGQLDHEYPLMPGGVRVVRLATQ
jgi:hypothetical protein